MRQFSVALFAFRVLCPRRGAVLAGLLSLLPRRSERSTDHSTTSTTINHVQPPSRVEQPQESAARGSRRKNEASGIVRQGNGNTVAKKRLVLPTFYLKQGTHINVELGRFYSISCLEIGSKHFAQRSFPIKIQESSTKTPREDIDAFLPNQGGKPC